MAMTKIIPTTNTTNAIITDLESLVSGMLYVLVITHSGVLVNQQQHEWVFYKRFIHVVCC